MIFIRAKLSNKNILKYFIYVLWPVSLFVLVYCVWRQLFAIFQLQVIQKQACIGKIISTIVNDGFRFFYAGYKKNCEKIPSHDFSF